MNIRMFLSNLKLLTDQARRLAPVLDWLRHHLALHAEKIPDTPIAFKITYIFSKFGRDLVRFDKLFHAWQQGTLKPFRPRAPQPRRERAKQTDRVKIHRLPASPAWLAKHAPGGLGFNNHLAPILAESEVQQFIAAEPRRAGRVLRPMMQALGLPLPAPLQRPKRVQKPRPKKPTPKKITKAELLETYPRPGVPRRWQLLIPGLNAPMLKRDREEIRRLKKETKQKH